METKTYHVECDDCAHRFKIVVEPPDSEDEIGLDAVVCPFCGSSSVTVEQ